MEGKDRKEGWRKKRNWSGRKGRRNGEKRDCNDGEEEGIGVEGGEEQIERKKKKKG